MFQEKKNHLTNNYIIHKDNVIVIAVDVGIKLIYYKKTWHGVFQISLEALYTTQQCLFSQHTVHTWYTLIYYRDRSLHITVRCLMRSHLTGTNPLFGWINEKFLQQINGLRRRVGDDFLQRDRRVIFKRDLVVIGQLCDLLCEEKIIIRKSYSIRAALWLSG